MPKGSRGLGADRIRELARHGAETVLKQLRAEIIAIERTFPELALPATRRAIRQTVQKARKRGQTMSAAARKEVSARMKKYWAERRKAKAKVK
jgi:Holliday junction resolvasome RuvABC endonuclease subunit